MKKQAMYLVKLVDQSDGAKFVEGLKKVLVENVAPISIDFKTYAKHCLLVIMCDGEITIERNIRKYLFAECVTEITIEKYGLETQSYWHVVNIFVGYISMGRNADIEELSSICDDFARRYNLHLSDERCEPRTICMLFTSMSPIGNQMVAELKKEIEKNLKNNHKYIVFEQTL